MSSSISNRAMLLSDGGELLSNVSIDLRNLKGPLLTAIVKASVLHPPQMLVSNESKTAAAQLIGSPHSHAFVSRISAIRKLTRPKCGCWKLTLTWLCVD